MSLPLLVEDPDWVYCYQCGQQVPSRRIQEHLQEECTP